MLKKTWVKVVLGVVLGVIMLGTILVLLFGAGLGVTWLMYTGNDMPVFKQISPGMTQEQVIQLAGKPDEVYTAAQAPGHYPTKGLGAPKRPITGKVLIYDRLEWTVYVFLDPADKVEEYIVQNT